MDIIRATGLTKDYGSTTVVNGIDFSVKPGTCYGLLGPNGAGKTTTLRMILGLCPATGGELRIFDQLLPACSAQVRARTGVVPQLDNLDPDFTVAENLAIYASYFGIERTVSNERIRQLLDFVSLTDRANARIGTLSGGMQRRLTIARALVNDPELVVLDEPTTGLDPQARHLIWQRLRDLMTTGKTLLLTTHYMEEAERLCDELAIMEQGEIIARGSPSDLINQHVLPEVVELRSQQQAALSLVGDYQGLQQEQAGDTVYIYGHDVQALLQQMDKISGVNYVHRPSNLEDVFLKLTGRELEE
jgi:lipooligosaccharide transport system ATP-binding protein